MGVRQITFRLAAAALLPAVLAAPSCTTPERSSARGPRKIQTFRAAREEVSAAVVKWRKDNPREPEDLAGFRVPAEALFEAVEELAEVQDPEAAKCLCEVWESDDVFKWEHMWSCSLHRQALSTAQGMRKYAGTFIERADAGGPVCKQQVLELLKGWKEARGRPFAQRCIAEGEGLVPFLAADVLSGIRGEEATRSLTSFLSDGRETVITSTDQSYPNWERFPPLMPFRTVLWPRLWVVQDRQGIHVSHTGYDISRRWTLGAYVLDRIEARGERVALTELEVMLHSSSLRLQQAAARHLGNYYPELAVRHLGGEWAHPYMQGLCAEICAVQGDPGARETLIRLTSSKDRLFRVYAVNALGRLDAAEARAHLVRLTSDPDPFVAETALAACAPRRRPLPSREGSRYLFRSKYAFLAPPDRPGDLEPELIRRALLSDEPGICEWARAHLKWASRDVRLRIAKSILEGDSAAVSSGGEVPKTDDFTEGGPAESPMDPEKSMSAAYTIEEGGGVVSLRDRAGGLWGVLGDIEEPQLAGLGREILGGEPVSGEPVGARRLLAAIAIAKAPTAEDLPRFQEWAGLDSPEFAEAAAVGLSKIGGAEVREALEALLEKVDRERGNWCDIEDSCIASLAEMGDEESWKRFMSHAPWEFPRDKEGSLAYEATAHLHTFMVGVLGSSRPDRESVLRRLGEWIRELSELDRIAFPSRVWARLLRTDRDAAERLLKIALSSGAESGAGWLGPETIPLLSPELRASLQRRVKRDRDAWALREWYEADRGWAVETAKRWLGEANLGKYDLSTALEIVLVQEDPADLRLVRRAAPDPFVLDESLRRLYGRYMSRWARAK
ncbi:MAG: HEAT repeat domain-containing protein [Planctomycetes bacterium]|nr:HEAT repeat domain-containing protein [Planctomycetota bacterium]